MAIEQESAEGEAIFQEGVRRGLVIDTGRKRLGKVSGKMQTVYALAPGVTPDMWFNQADAD